MRIILESTDSLCSFDLYYEHSSAETASNLTGHGRVLGLALSALGKKLERGIAALARVRENGSVGGSVVRTRDFSALHTPVKQKIHESYPDILMRRLYRAAQTQRVSQIWPDDAPFTIRAYRNTSRLVASKRYAQELLKCARSSRYEIQVYTLITIISYLRGYWNRAQLTDILRGAGFVNFLQNYPLFLDFHPELHYLSFHQRQILTSHARLLLAFLQDDEYDALLANEWNIAQLHENCEDRTTVGDLLDIGFWMLQERVSIRRTSSTSHLAYYVAASFIGNFLSSVQDYLKILSLNGRESKWTLSDMHNITRLSSVILALTNVPGPGYSGGLRCLLYKAQGDHNGRSSRFHQVLIFQNAVTDETIRLLSNDSDFDEMLVDDLVPLTLEGITSMKVAGELDEAYLLDFTPHEYGSFICLTWDTSDRARDAGLANLGFWLQELSLSTRHDGYVTYRSTPNSSLVDLHDPEFQF